MRRGGKQNAQSFQNISNSAILSTDPYKYSQLYKQNNVYDLCILHRKILFHISYKREQLQYYEFRKKN
jgi:hypothetical protein